jgi:hypothetical protein
MKIIFVFQILHSQQLSIGRQSWRKEAAGLCGLRGAGRGQVEAGQDVIPNVVGQLLFPFERSFCFLSLC